MYNITTKLFQGIDVNDETSLFENGLLASIDVDKDGQHACLYAVSSEGNLFDVGYLSEDDLNNKINESWFDKDGFLSYLGMFESDWLALDFVFKLSDLLSYYGYENIFGNSYGSFFEADEAVEWLNNFELITE